MFKQIIEKEIILPPNWEDNNYEGYSQYIQEASKASKAVSRLMTDPNIKVESIVIKMTINISEVVKESND